jgi:hypothetical protein
MHAEYAESDEKGALSSNERVFFSSVSACLDFGPKGMWILESERACKEREKYRIHNPQHWEHDIIETKKIEKFGNIFTI